MGVVQACHPIVINVSWGGTASLHSSECLQLKEAAHPEDTKVARTVMQSLWLQKNMSPSFITKQRSSRVLVLAEKIDISLVAKTTMAPGQQLFGFLVAGSFVPPRWKPHPWHLAGFQRVEYVLLQREHSPNPRFVLVEGIIGMLQRNHAMSKNEAKNEEQRTKWSEAMSKRNQYIQ